MGYIEIPTRVADVDVNAAADINQLMENIKLFAGNILPFGGTVAPSGTLLCDGSAVSRTTYATLFAAIGTTWGVGDGSTTFNIPDGAGMVLRGTGSHGSETKADGSAYEGAAPGAYQDDLGQQITGGFNLTAHAVAGASSFATSVTGAFVRDGAATIDNVAVSGTSNNERRINLDSGASTAQGGSRQDGDEFRGANAGVTHIIKY